MSSTRSTTSTRSRRSTRTPAPGSRETRSMSEDIRREPVIWGTDPMRREVNLGPVPLQLTTRTITWYDAENECVATSVVIYNDQGKEVSELRAVFMGPYDPILLHRLHRLVGALKFIDDRQLGLATAAATNNTPYQLEGVEFAPANAEAELRNQLAEGYDAAVNLLSDDVARDITLLRECNLEVSTVLVTEECVAGRLEFTQKLADLGVVSPEQIQARNAARAAILDPLKPFLDSFAESHGLKASDRTIMELSIIDLASRGETENDLLLGHGVVSISQRLNQIPPAVQLAGALIGGLVGLMMTPVDHVSVAARYVKSVMPDSSRDEQWTRWALAGIQHDLANNRMAVKRNDVR